MYKLALRKMSCANLMQCYNIVYVRDIGKSVRLKIQTEENEKYLRIHSIINESYHERSYRHGSVWKVKYNLIIELI